MNGVLTIWATARIIYNCGLLPYAMGLISQARRILAARTVTVMVLCSSTSLVAESAHGQDPAVNGIEAPKTAASSWSGAGASRPAPNLLLSMADVSRF
jgi:hypothetical protein